MGAHHHYAVNIAWTGNRGTGTSSYRDYGRDHLITAPGKEPISASADPTFHGDADRWNPEELLLAALSECHLMSYLHVAVKHGVQVVDYTDDATGSMAQTTDGGGHFTEVTLRPRVTVADPGQVELAQSLHAEAASLCFIGASVNFPVVHQPQTVALADTEV
ncbi:OsmC family peroxiredoxin [Cryobacterium sp. TMT1-19]|uniref:OsmC family protein n=1 Tax=Cryobacterium sp. TMT1-19 TaxID=1259231 RepID=UPI001069EAED|nr:OsmC family protein [Cryobacterium sp. TMT1-19]TFD31436.1 OsmC family peroxiredoxin [Cryobacterium sp. TMT1-19]